MSFQDVLTKYRTQSFSTHDQGDRFERLMKRYLMTDPKYATEFKRVDLWMEFYARDQLGGIDTGIDLVAETLTGEYWAIQCKCYKETDRIDKDEVNKFLGTYGKSFTDREGNPGVGFSQGLWISTVPASNWTSTANEALNNQRIPVARINLADLERAPVDWDKLEEGTHGVAARVAKYNILQHQQKAIDNAKTHYQAHDRGKMIMACGTGKTFVSLKISEELKGPNDLILFLAPSIALVGQTLREWTAQCKSDIHPICVCSDPKVTKQKKKNDDDDSGDRVIDLGLPATTDPGKILSDYRMYGTQQTTVIFSTYQSIEVVSEAQKLGLPDFDLIVCDEAHRTTGVRLAEDKEKAFTMVHDNGYVKGLKRLYMTATPRIYSENAKKKAEDGNVVMRSMDDESLFGTEFYHIGFGEAVEKGLLSDYKVMILTINERMIPPGMADQFYNISTQIDMDAALKLMGCISALSKIVEGDDTIRATDPGFMHSAVAFCNTIKMSEDVADWFNNYSRKYLEILPDRYNGQVVKVSGKTVSSQMSISDREDNMTWLKGTDIEDDRCRIVTNVRCLSEGVDVPALDAIMFLSAKNSQIDVVQSVGRVMRKPRTGDKKFGYIIIPIIADPEKTPNEALENNENYKVVWTVLNALRAHDDRLKNIVNKLDLMNNKGGKIIIGGPGGSGGGGSGGQTTLPLDLDGWQEALYAKIVKKVGDRMYWSDWADDVGKLAIRTIGTIREIVKKPACRDYFDSFVSELRSNIHDSIDDEQAIEMLAQHIITQPIFEALFEDYSFSKHNPVSKAMDSMIDVLVQTDSSINDFKSLDKFYSQVKERVEKIDNARGKQTVILELYNNFFQAAFPKMAKKLGIVYTPVEVVDFIINSVNDLLRFEFDCDYNDENVNIIDPFTGTGTFITRLIQSGLISKDNLPRKYTYEIFANEIVLLAYYIASVNIESTYHDVMGDSSYTAFDGLCLTDTFDKNRIKIESAHIFNENRKRITRMVNAPINVIIGNPPYSVGQESTNDNNKNQTYPLLEKRVAETYAAMSGASNKNRLYDSYLLAFRYASDRLGNNNGIICFVSNGGWLDGTSMVGFRKAIESEFYKIYVFNLRGNQRTSGELSRKEGGKIFDSGSRAAITITLLIKKADYSGKATIYYKDIGDYLSRIQKLNKIKELGSFANPLMKLEKLEPGEEGDWITEHNSLFKTFIPLEPEKKFEEGQSVFLVNSIGYNTSRDAWMINFSKKELAENISRFIDFYNTQTPQNKSNDKTKIAWSSGLETLMSKSVKIGFDADKIEPIMYRPFNKMYLYNEEKLIERNYQNRKLFPTKESENLVIAVNGIGMSAQFGAFISKIPMNIQCMPNGQCFSLYYYTEKGEKLSKKGKTKQATLFPVGGPKQMTLDDGSDELQEIQYVRHDGISDWFYRKAIGIHGDKVTKKDLFYYIYGLLHSKHYREAFAGDLKKGLPRIPLIEDKKGFWAFVNAGRALADLHLNYENVEPWPGVLIDGDVDNCKVPSKMKFERKDDKSSIMLNGHLSVTNIPLRAYDYFVGGRPAIEWVMERYQLKTEPNSQIRNDPNLYAEENKDPKYVVNLLMSVISVSMKTLEIQDSLPELVFKEN